MRVHCTRYKNFVFFAQCCGGGVYSVISGSDLFLLRFGASIPGLAAAVGELAPGNVCFFPSAAVRRVAGRSFRLEQTPLVIWFFLDCMNGYVWIWMVAFLTQLFGLLVVGPVLGLQG